jgi:hypothetical protein
MSSLSMTIAMVCCISLQATEPRTWSDQSGKFTVKAKFAGIKVLLQKEDGQIIEIPLEHLSNADQQHVKDVLVPRPIAKPAASPVVEAKPAASPVVEQRPRAAAPEARDDPIVYVTRTGSKYHSAGCSSLKKSSTPMRLSEAKLRYSACSRCNPP